jgi:phosphotransferase system HPr-like phosphotransfer protein
MSITLTDKDGIQFNIQSSIIVGIIGTPTGTEVQLCTGETILCKEDAVSIMSTLIKAKFFGGGR